MYTREGKETELYELLMEALKTVPISAENKEKLAQAILNPQRKNKDLQQPLSNVLAGETNNALYKLHYMLSIWDKDERIQKMMEQEESYRERSFQGQVNNRPLKDNAEHVTKGVWNAIQARDLKNKEIVKNWLSIIDKYVDKLGLDEPTSDKHPEKKAAKEGLKAILDDVNKGSYTAEQVKAKLESAFQEFARISQSEQTGFLKSGKAKAANTILEKLNWQTVNLDQVQKKSSSPKVERKSSFEEPLKEKAKVVEPTKSTKREESPPPRVESPSPKVDAVSQKVSAIKAKLIEERKKLTELANLGDDYLYRDRDFGWQVHDTANMKGLSHGVVLDKTEKLIEDAENLLNNLPTFKKMQALEELERNLAEQLPALDKTHEAITNAKKNNDTKWLNLVDVLLKSVEKIETGDDVARQVEKQSMLDGLNSLKTELPLLDDRESIKQEFVKSIQKLNSSAPAKAFQTKNYNSGVTMFPPVPTKEPEAIQNKKEASVKQRQKM